MRYFKLYIVWYMIQHRFNRVFRSNRIGSTMKKKWFENLQKSKFYKEYKQNLEDFPIINKAIFMDNFDGINTKDITKKQAFGVALKSEETRDFSPEIGDVSVGLSSGTSGNKGLFLVTPRERALWVSAVLDRVIGFSFRPRKVAFFLRANNNLYESVKSKLIQFQFYDIKSPIREHVDNLIKTKPNILIAQPSVLFEIAQIFEAKNIRMTFDKIISVAEVLEEDQKAYFESVFNQKIDQVYQATEGFLAHTCRLGQLHFNEDWLTIEKKYIDGSTKRFHPIITDYMRYAQPVIRYELNDIIHEGKPCQCGLKSTVIEKIEGRSDDVFKFDVDGKEVIIFPDFLRRAVVTSSDTIVNYQIVRTAKNEISIAINGDKQGHLFEKVKISILDLFDDFGIKNVHIIKGTIIKNPMKKFKRIANEYS